MCAEFERGVKRAECHDCCEQEHRAENNEHNSEGSGDDAAKVQISEHGGEHDTDDAISIGHIAFHSKSPLVGLK